MVRISVMCYRRIKLWCGCMLVGIGASAQNYAIVTQENVKVRVETEDVKLTRLVKKGLVFDMIGREEDGKDVPVWFDWKGKQLPARVSREGVSLFRATRLSPDALLKTYKLVSPGTGDVRGKLDFIALDSLTLMRLRWAVAKKKAEYHVLEKDSVSLWLKSFVSGKLPKDSRELLLYAETWVRPLRFYYDGEARAFFDGGNLYFAEDRKASPKDDVLLSLASIPEKMPETELVAWENQDSVQQRNPQFPGGEQACMDYLMQNIKYPPICRELGIQGRVIVQFMVGEDGSISEIEVVRSPDRDLSAEAVRLIKYMPKWKPAINGGKPVRCKFTLPVTFRLK